MTNAQKGLLVADLKKYNVASITPVIIDPEIIYLILNVNFKFDSNRTTKEKDTLISDITTTLTNHNNNNLKKLRLKLYIYII